jgi:pimeloyl-ACP methyl ester carboxylesterase
LPDRRSRHRSPDRCYPALDERVSARDVRLRSGLNVRAVEGGPPDGAPVVLLPGWGVSAFTYRHQLPALGAAGYRATAVDLKGHGFSDKPRGGGEYTFEAMVRHVRDVIEAIADRPAVVVAQSMAGSLAIELALENSGLVSGLVLVSPVGLGSTRFARVAQLLTPEVLDAAAPYVVARWVMRAGLAAAYGDSAKLTEDVIDEYWAPAQFPGFACALRGLVRNFNWAPIPEARLAALDARTLIVLGARDRLIRGAPQRATRLSAPTVVVVTDAGHAVNEERAEAVNAAILEFLSRLHV